MVSTTEKEEGLNGRSLNYPRGRVLGGSSAINGMIYMRGQAKILTIGKRRQYWLGWDDVLPYFKKSEDHFKGADDFHGELALGGLTRLSWEVWTLLQRHVHSQVFRQPRILIAAQILVSDILGEPT